MAEFAAVDYLQLARSGSRTLRIIVENVGVIEVLKGQLYSARDDGGDGYEALIRILMRGGLDYVRAHAYCLDSPPLESRNLELGMDEAILEAARRIDEEQDKLLRPALARPCSLGPQVPVEHLQIRGTSGVDEALRRGLETRLLTPRGPSMSSGLPNDEALPWAPELLNNPRVDDDPTDDLSSTDLVVDYVFSAADYLEQFEAVEQGIEAMLDGEYEDAYRLLKKAELRGAQLGLVEANLSQLKARLKS